MMFKLTQKSIKQFSLLIAFVCALAFSAQAQTTAFTYQGKLTDASAAANGNYDFEFRLYDSGGTQQGATLTRLNVAVTNGIFTVSLDFGLAAFDTVSRRTLEIAVRPAGGGAYTILSPRQAITAAPLAIRANSSTNAVNANNADALGGLGASQYVQTNDARLSDDRNPLAGSTNYIQNSSALQTGTSNFNINGNGTLGGTLQAFNLSASNNATVQNNLNVQGTITGNGSGLTSLNAANISSGILGVGNGGTGLTSSGGAGRFLRSNGTTWTSAGISSSDVPNLDAGKITTGTFSDTLLSSNIPRLNQSNTFTLNQTFSGGLSAQTVTATGAITAIGGFSGSGSSLTNLNATNITTGTLDATRIPTLDANKITTGTLSDARLSSNIPRLNTANTFTGNQAINGNQTINGNVIQSATGNGLPKAIIVVKYIESIQNYQILSCYNGVSGNSTGNCGYTTFYDAFLGFFIDFTGINVTNRPVLISSTDGATYTKSDVNSSRLILFATVNNGSEISIFIF